MRGILLPGTDLFLLHRFIPAHAGNTCLSPLQRNPPPVHPRTCGEYNNSVLVAVAYAGSSPHMRGIHDKRLRKSPKRRFIPAHAGNTYVVDPRNTSRTVHPRTCGEYCPSVNLDGQFFGSSPHMRGIPGSPGRTGRMSTVHPHTCGEYADRSPDGPSMVRFIPAHAGNTKRDRLIPPQEDGSSPHMRGIRPGRRARRRGRRFIPAHAGNTPSLPQRWSRQAVHPRTCGEYGSVLREIDPIAGSSPHMRGILTVAISVPVPHRFIPAHAGNTWSALSGRTCNPVHPRTCGEYFHGRPSGQPARGSSPHMRGIHLLLSI